MRRLTLAVAVAAVGCNRPAPEPTSTPAVPVANGSSISPLMSRLRTHSPPTASGVTDRA